MKTFNQFLEEAENKRKPRRRKSPPVWVDGKPYFNKSGKGQNRSNSQLFPYNTPPTRTNNNQSSSEPL